MTRAAQIDIVGRPTTSKAELIDAVRGH